MRDEKDWKTRTRDVYLNNFPPRIQRDLRQIGEPTDMPDPIGNYYIHSKVGFGKTILAAQMMLQEQKNIWKNNGPKDSSERCCFVSVPTLFQEIKDTYNKDSAKTESQIIAYYNNFHLLVLDDFASVKPTDWVLQTLYLIINYRYDFLKKIILTSNLSLSEAATFFGDDRIPSRIDRMCEIIEKTDWKRK